MTAAITEHQQQQPGNLRVYNNLIQGSDEWLQARCGILTASVTGQFITQGTPDALTLDCPRCESPAGSACISTARKVPTPIKTVHDERTYAANALPPVLKTTANEYTRNLTLTLVSERITGYVDPTPMSRDMERGTLDEPYARDKYSEHHAPAREVGFMVREYDWGSIGYSPDGLVGDDGLIEIKAPKPKKHLATILAGEVPLEHMAQIQTGLLVSGRDWLDFISYSGGMPLWTRRVHPDPVWHAAILEAAQTFETTSAAMIATYQQLTSNLPATERINHYLDPEIY
ncbi:YqaJ viral recombinase family protein [Paenarthrobacter sp. NPDC018779]|uniref:YqaJ viral recombinase family protein n=1 Tax=Paenarthrobacter sp. NPDC018779 TaxID=3364375 RepID=UPI0037CC879C